MPLDQRTGQLSPTFPHFQPSPPSLYRVNEVPSPPLHIEAMIDLRNIVEVSERKQMVTLEATFILCWTDQRYTPNLDYTTGDYAIIGPEFLTNFWLPDILIDQVGGWRG